MDAATALGNEVQELDELHAGNLIALLDLNICSTTDTGDNNRFSNILCRAAKSVPLLPPVNGEGPNLAVTVVQH